MKNTPDLRQKFQTMIRWRRNVSVCRILTEMLDRGELRYQALDTKGPSGRLDFERLYPRGR